MGKETPAEPTAGDVQLEVTAGEVQPESTNGNRGGQQRIPRPESFRVAGPPPWADLDPADGRLSLDDVRARLAGSPPGAAPTSLVPDSVAAAVLVPVVELRGEAHILFIKRPETMST